MQKLVNGRIFCEYLAVLGNFSIKYYMSRWVCTGRHGAPKQIHGTHRCHTFNR